uniref:Retrovirus-related Pol polyprotein from transposon TNT 1-94 n=1 Tax=Cajanus cajan TaxID=3821 RepID=A0A151RPE4_CAJCA|nr:Retrovirus-related Pol polyprotein from transposon TNT 1-94 [Cajanus cajan]
MDPNTILTIEAGDLLPDPSLYRRLIGRLLYLTISRLDITYIVHKLSQFMQSPRSTHLKAIHHLLQYLKGTPGKDILFPSDSKLKQNTVSKSSTEAEYRSIFAASSELIWLQRLLTHFEVHISSAMLLCDNKSAISLATNPGLHKRSKHIDIDHLYIRELVEEGCIKLIHVKAEIKLLICLQKHYHNHSSKDSTASWLL